MDPDGVTTLYQYDARGRLVYTAVDLNNNGVIDFNGADRITETLSDVMANNEGEIVNRTRTFVWATNGVAVSNLVSDAETSVESLEAWNVLYNNGLSLTNYSETEYYPGGSVTFSTSLAPDGSSQESYAQYGRIISTARLDANDNEISQAAYDYDALGRPITMADARNGVTTSFYNSADQVVAALTPSPDAVQPGQLTTNILDTLGRVIQTIQPDGTSVTNVYYANGLLQETYGSRTYPVQYTYDYAGRMKTMTTWTNFASSGGAAVTTWNYDAYRGSLTNKAYADGKGPGYTYTPAGRLQTRTWARGVTTTDVYDSAGELSQVNYSDSTPGIAYGFDRLGRQTSVTNGSVVSARVYNFANELLSETYLGGPLNGLTVTNTYDALLRRQNLAVDSSAGVLASTIYGYDAASRLATVGDGTNTAVYTYLANSPLVGNIGFQHNGQTVMTTTKTYDYLNRLTAIQSAAGSSPVSSFNYNYNLANQRTAATNVDNSYWVYQYDSLGQVVSGKKYWANGTPVAGQQFTYNFDTIGNRQSSASGGDGTGSNLRIANYAANNLNEYASRGIPSYAEISGSANANATVTVNLQRAVRQGNYFWDELGVSNSTSPLWLALTNLAVLNNGTNADIIATNLGNVLVKQSPEVFNYDADGNLTNDGRWAYTWDGENRLVKLIANTTVGPQYQLNFAYDAQSRRIQKIVATNGMAISTNNFVYDGWNLAAELNPNGTLIRSYVWGTDLSGSAQGAGGVGGLIAVSYHGSATTNCFTAFDGNGNIAALVNAADGSVSANYEYAAFGEVVRSTGPLARNNPFRFSTKYQDDESDLLYYGYRYYNASTGRWPNRDPLRELAGANLYAFVDNNPLNSFDVLGLSQSSDAVLGMVQLFQKALKACSCDKDLARDMEDTFNSYLSDNKQLNDVIKNIQEALEQAKAQMKLDNGGVNDAIDKVDENEKLTKLLLMKMGGLSWKDSNHALTLIKSVAGANGIIDHIDNTLNNADALTSGDALEIFLQAGTYVSKVPGPVGQLGKFFDWYDEAYKGSKSALGRLAYSDMVNQSLEQIAGHCHDDQSDSALAVWQNIKHYFKPFDMFSL